MEQCRGTRHGNSHMQPVGHEGRAILLLDTRWRHTFCIKRHCSPPQQTERVPSPPMTDQPWLIWPFGNDQPAPKQSGIIGPVTQRSKPIEVRIRIEIGSNGVIGLHSIHDQSTIVPMLDGGIPFER
jgi:hypothetical protein